MGLGRWCAVFVGLACLAPGSAWASHVPGAVTLGNDRQIAPLLKEIDPGQSVTWEWVGPDTNHSTTSMHNLGVEIWDSDEGVPTNDIDHPPIGGVNQTFSRQFSEPGTYFYGCRVHDTMRANIRVRGIPTAVVTANPANPLTDQDVTFNGGNSFDDAPGTIVNYEWDIDGNTGNGFELDTDGVSTTSRSYATPSPPTIAARLRVTDDDGRTAIATVNITVRSRVPVASFNFSASPQKGQPVTFTSNSTDTENDIVKHEWDLNNDGTFERDTGAVGNTQETFPSAGPRTVGLRVTDAGDRQSSTTRMFTVANQLPTASFTAAPGTVLTGETVSFDGTASSDVAPGTIASYAWDLDGDNTFETSTGTTPTTSRSYSSAGTVTARLRVTDDDGGTATTSRTVTVNAPPSSTPPPQDPPPAESPPPVLPAPSVSGGSTPLLPPVLTLRGPAKQRALRQRGLIVTAGCDRGCALAARGTVNVPGASKVFRLRQASRSLPAAGSARFKLTLPRAAQTAIRRALRGRKRVTATITVAATDAAGTGTQTRRIRIIG